jgi:hypothetical protein
MEPLAAAVFTAALALAAKVSFDIWERHYLRRSVSAALAGEISAYMEMLDPPTTTANFRAMATLDPATRRVRLRAMPKPPAGHPVFDKLADRIGLLPAAEAREVSVLYNLVTGLRTTLSALSTQEMADADDAMQIALVNFMANALDRYHPRALKLVERLEGISGQTAWSRRRRI